MVGKVLFKNDRYRKNRGGYSRWLSVCCAKCGQEITVYQKDGPGILKRLYLDRMTIRPNWSKELSCGKCHTILGVKTVYEKERRPAYRLFVGAVEKIIKKDGVNR